MLESELGPSPLEDWSYTPLATGRQLLIKRDDLLPFPLAGNKIRKLLYELADVNFSDTAIVTVGAINSNHCRTAAMLAARHGGQAHLILHGNPGSASAKVTLSMLHRLGATCKLVEPKEIPEAIDKTIHNIGREVHFIEGGCHTAKGVDSYIGAVKELSLQIGQSPDYILLASGTGATQAGVIAGCHEIGWNSTRVIGVSVARDKPRGTSAIREALSWRNLEHLPIEFTPDYRAGGYGNVDEKIEAAIEFGWRNGLPLDGTYTGKAFSALLDPAGPVPEGANVLFWHTGGLNTQISRDIDSKLPQS